jgi:hypothetical protein
MSCRTLDENEEKLLKYDFCGDSTIDMNEVR